MTPSDPDRAEDLIQRHLEGGLDESGRRELEGLLNREADARRALVRSMRVHAALRVHFGGIGRIPAAPGADPRPIADGEPGERRGRRRAAPRIVWAAAAALATLLAGVAWVVLSPGAPPAIACLEQVQGRVRVLTDGRAEDAPAAAGRALAPGQGLSTAEPDGRARVRYPDATRVSLEPGTTVLALDHAGAAAQKRVIVTRGIVTLDVSPQPADRPMILATPVAQVDVLGTRLRLAVDPGGTRLDVYAGRARLTRRDGSTALVTGGEQATATGRAPSPPRLLWEIGRLDGHGDDLALAPGGYLDYRDDPSYRVGRSSPRRDWPYVHPGPMDAWAGNQSHAFHVAFDVVATADAGTCRLVLDLLDVHEFYPPQLRIDINGAFHEIQVSPGSGRRVYGLGARGRPQHLAVEFPASRLKAGTNHVELTTMEGSWMLYDRVALEAPAGVQGRETEAPRR